VPLNTKGKTVTAAEQLKRDLLAKMRTSVAQRELDVSESQITLDFTRELPSDYEGCESVYTARAVRLVDGQLVVVAASEDDETTCDEADLLSQSVETIEALAGAVETAAKGA
jgi:hypothetical protein